MNSGADLSVARYWCAGTISSPLNPACSKRGQVRAGHLRPDTMSISSRTKGAFYLSRDRLAVLHLHTIQSDSWVRTMRCSSSTVPLISAQRSTSDVCRRCCRDWLKSTRSAMMVPCNWTSEPPALSNVTSRALRIRSGRNFGLSGKAGNNAANRPSKLRNSQSIGPSVSRRAGCSRAPACQTKPERFAGVARGQAFDLPPRQSVVGWVQLKPHVV